MRYLIIFSLIFFSLFLVGCSSDDVFIHDCQEGCLSKNMSYSGFKVFDYKNNSELLRCECNFYLEDE